MKTRPSQTTMEEANGGGSRPVSRESGIKSANDWRAEIQERWAETATSILPLASVVLLARRSLRHGEWAALWESGRMPFSKRKAEMLVSIGQGLGDLNANTCAHLPRGWRVLYLLSKLDREILLREITNGAIHPKLTLNAARELVACLQGRLTRKPVHPGKIERRLGRFREFVHQTLNDGARAECALVRQTLYEL
ncbi:MAG: hypothetical protein HY043_22160, partial [Verrucomicrobia bacterium]|nr:hypothetical protein [Verrucomicrobiota bacterium]